MTREEKLKAVWDATNTADRYCIGGQRYIWIRPCIVRLDSISGKTCDELLAKETA